MAEQPSIPYRTTGSTLLHPVSDLLGVPLDQEAFRVDVIPEHINFASRLLVRFSTLVNLSVSLSNLSSICVMAFSIFPVIRFIWFKIVCVELLESKDGFVGTAADSIESPTWSPPVPDNCLMAANMEVCFNPLSFVFSILDYQIKTSGKKS
nr:PREDICTED: lysophospholipid acyltransferase 1 isoform X1 [Latimeria chalumnae]XP_014344654.1 PREDICTED: lysophospholipid acyltransferase 1 isoform X1 [Latimeria chalumnae]|eukprot:XP_014344653.1 PREDICTED: lysophospholipid acyltransferase 1 isoform X1 [Latimeria chalumnae]